MGSVLRLTVVLAAGWVLCFWPAKSLNPETGVKWMSIAALCCLVPGWIVVLLERLAIFPNALVVMLVQTSVRMATVGGAVVVVKRTHPEIGLADFYGWLIGFYLLALLVEVQLLRRDERQATGVTYQQASSVKPDGSSDSTAVDSDT